MSKSAVTSKVDLWGKRCWFSRSHNQKGRTHIELLKQQICDCTIPLWRIAARLRYSRFRFHLRFREWSCHNSTVLWFLAVSNLYTKMPKWHLFVIHISISLQLQSAAVIQRLRGICFGNCALSWVFAPAVRQAQLPKRITQNESLWATSGHCIYILASMG